MLKLISKISATSTLIFFLVGCQNYEFPQPPYSKVETLDVTNLSSGGVTFRGNFIRLGDTADIIDHGFVWGLGEHVTQEGNSEGTLDLGSASFNGEFQGNVASGFQNGTTYYVKAFVVTNAYKVYGAPVAFRK